MGTDLETVARAAARLAKELPLATVVIAADHIGSSVDLFAAEGSMVQLPHPHYRQHVASFLEECRRVIPPLPPQAVALALLTAAHCEQAHRDDQSVELVWTGPDAEVVPFRRTAQAILQVLDSAKQRITLVSYAVYRIPHVCEALVRAARRGVRITVIVETPNRIEGQGEYSTLRALGDEVANCAAVYFWPQEKRRQSEAGKVGILHVKCVVADGKWLLLSSANFTEYAFDINMELGLLLTGGKLATQVEANFDQLIADDVLQRI